MLIISHNNKQVISVLDESLKPVGITFSKNETLISALLTIANQVDSKTLIVWCRHELVNHLNTKVFRSVCHHQHILATFNTDSQPFLTHKIDYLERSICLKLNTENSYGTYVMSSQVGVMQASTFLKFKDEFNLNDSLNYNLNSIAKNYQILGLFCYNEPKLLQKNYPVLKEESILNSQFFKFVREHYKWVWVWFIWLSLVVLEKRFFFFSFINAWRFKQKQPKVKLDANDVQSTNTETSNKSIDVVIPTIGRKAYLKDVLKDLAQQTILPKQVIIVEQNGDKSAVSDLDYLVNESWPFTITHEFTHTLGVCNARNLALKHIKNEWVFFADDDIRFNTDLFEKTFSTINKFGSKVLNYSCLQPNQKQMYFDISQTFIFGSGSSFVKASVIKNLEFSKAFEFGFGEDTDFGAKIRQNGTDVVFAANINLTHLKAPMGGFRQPIPKLWDNNTVKPVPAPTMLLLYKNHFTAKQLKGYKLFLFIKLNGKKNPFKIISNYKLFKKSWNKSVFYSSKLARSFNA